MIYPKIPLAQTVIEIFRLRGVRTIVISPGSRNAPLTIGFSSHPDFTCYSIADERSAAFFALGIAQQTQKPVAVVCTSGSAVLNYYPAFAEAFYNQIPLVVVSADRPHDKIDIGDGQTIRQEHVFGNHSLYNANLTEAVSAENDFLINEALSQAISQKGPVHINVPFEEPLYETVNQLSVSPQVTNSISQVVATFDMETLAAQWNASRKILVLVGGMHPGLISEQVVDFLGNQENVMVMTEVTSNIHNPNFITNIDTIITSFSTSDFETFKPDLLVTFGGMIVSKRIKSFLRTFKPNQHWHIDTLRAYDTFGCLSAHIQMDVNPFFDNLMPLIKPVQSSYQNDFLKVRHARALRHTQYLDQIPFCDLAVFDMILPQIPPHFALQISNSSPIRYAQLISINPKIEVFCNRGTSGIDGSTSTAVGAAVASKKPTLLITGDIGFFYDSNGLWNNYIPNDFKIVLINNGGGGIFRILPGHQENETFTTFFETSHCLTAQHLAAMYGFTYFFASDENTLQNGFDQLIAANNKAILEVFTPTKLNDRYLLDYFTFLGEN